MAESAVLDGLNVLVLLIGAVMVLAMHAGFAFLEVGTVSSKNQVNALVKILVDFAVSTIAYFFIGYYVAYGMDFFASAANLEENNGFALVKFFFLLTFAAAIPAIVSGGIAERAKFYPQMLASFLIVALLYPFFEGIIWNGNFGINGTGTTWGISFAVTTVGADGANVTVGLIEHWFGAAFHDFAGSIVVHAFGGWIALGAVLLLGARRGRYKAGGQMSSHPPSSIPFLALGSWTLAVGWFGFNVMSAQSVEGLSGLVAVNSLMAMVGGILTSLVVGKNDPGFIHNGALAGLVAVCAGSDLMHPIGALTTGAVAGMLFVWAFTLTQNVWKIDDVLGVWPLHGLCGVWGGIAAGIFGLESMLGKGGVSLMSQVVGTAFGVIIAFIGGLVIYGVLKLLMGIRLSEEDEYEGADLSIHKMSAVPGYER
ncbi:MAG: ammonium transporter [Methylococcales bacterium]|nr:ammonium transporter [Methylococcales bacterium]MBT7445961.1 ammonium transporter [Methylococcales bacterium]